MQSSYPGSYFEKLNEYLTWQTSRIRELELRVEQLSKEMDALRKQKGITIEKIEYNFDQLKVETLEGTLNVGLSPAGLGEKSLDDVMVGDKSSIVMNTGQTEAFERIKRAVFTYLDEHCPVELKSLEAQYQMDLDDVFCNYIIEDLRGQTVQRIEYYLHSKSESGKTSLPPEEERAITEKVIGDIRIAMKQYMTKMKNQGGNFGDLTSGK